jgi:hypothetical protein
MANTDSTDKRTPEAPPRETARSGLTPEDIEAAGLPGRPRSLPPRRTTSCQKTRLANTAQGRATSARGAGHVRALASRVKSSIRRRAPKDQATTIRIRLLEQQRKLFQKERVNLLGALRRNDRRRVTNEQMVAKLREPSTPRPTEAGEQPNSAPGESSWKTMRLPY